MHAPSRLNRLLTFGVATCAVTWAFAGGATARPIMPPVDRDHAGDAPAYKLTTGDHSVPVVAGKTAPPPYKVAAGDRSVPNAAQVQGVLDNVGRGQPTRVERVVAAADGNTDTIAMILSIVAMLTACGAVTLTVTRSGRGAVGA
jgi:hypothetical protein